MSPAAPAAAPPRPFPSHPPRRFWPSATPARQALATLSAPWPLALGATAALMPATAEAHVKWFCAFDVSLPPRAVADVLDATFFWIGAVFAVLLFLGFLLDRLAHDSAWDAAVDRFLAPLAGFEEKFMRVGVGAFFTCLWVKGGVILTPELSTTSELIPWLQFVFAACTIWRRTCLITGLGIIGLYLHAASIYGYFHLVDYPVFLGIATYMILTGLNRPRYRLPIIYLTAGITLMWAGIEKFGYPHWTLPLLVEHSRITFGIDFDIYMLLAGFVEFSLAYFLITGTAILRLGAFYLLFIFCAAVIDFGKLDAIGHMLIIIALTIMCFRGKTPLQQLFVRQERSIVAEAATMTALHFALLATFFALYYGIQALEYRMA
jgi:hypothetical protein